MASSSRTLRASWLRNTRLQSRSWTRYNSSFAHLQQDLPKRAIQPTFEDLSPQSSYRLDMTLADFLPKTNPPPVLPPTQLAKELPIPHHLLYFEPSKRQSDMLPDGTNPDQSPGQPFERRMWAGGRVLYNQNNPLLLDGSRGVCQEFIRRVDIKGTEGQEKIFVAIERRLAKASPDEVSRLAAAMNDTKAKEDLNHRVRQRLWRDSEEDFGECSILETRNIVFMRGRTPEQAKSDASKKPGSKILKPEHTPDYTHTILPDPKLLFRFSALTFNAHAIHLDPSYSREIEGHRNLLFHGPMSFTFLVTLLQQKLAQEGNEVIKSVEYRNVAPLYCGEEVKFAGKKLDSGKWEIWAETPEGGIAVKGKVVTEKGNVDKSELGR
ncbi:hypothetical protein CBER1_06148 [Cercospora berteroae]|uniref:MaoC-like domain-containing protein n=1 Tax=Cercospora berteroae TaxID=357750 RepID=A0A2S6C4G7_9PEZI|nr:hypothetical protein CBER1_06148 [Cercospora berteroae]